MTVPVGFTFVTDSGGVLVSTPVSVTVTVHDVDWFRFRTLLVQVSAVVVTCPASTTTVPVSVSSLKYPLHAVLLEVPAPGTQSLIAEFELELARVSVWSPISAPVGLKALSGNDA